MAIPRGNYAREGSSFAEVRLRNASVLGFIAVGLLPKVPVPFLTRSPNSNVAGSTSPEYLDRCMAGLSGATTGRGIRS